MGLVVRRRRAEQLRHRDLSVALHGTPDGKTASFKSQMKKADASGARFAIILGPDEVAAGLVSVKNLREGGEQQKLPLDDVALIVKRAALNTVSMN